MNHKYSFAFVFIFSIAILAQINKSFAGTGDTTVVQTLRFDTTMRAGVFMFPIDTTKTYEKITMLYSMRCKNGWISTSTDRNKGCGEWDYNCFTYVVDSSQTDSLKSAQSSYSISNSSDTVYEFTNIPVWSYTQYVQHDVSYTNITSEDSSLVGAGVTSLNSPFSTSAKLNRSQYLWKASELSAAGLTAGSITGMRMDILTLGSSVGNLRIRIKTTAQTSLDENNPETDGFTEVYFLSTLFSNTGKHSFNFSNPFNWNGTSNIIIDFSFTNTFTGMNTVLKGDSLASAYNLNTTVLNDSYLNGTGSLSYMDVNSSIYPAITDKITVAFWAFGDSLLLPANTSILEGNDSSGQRQINIHLPWSDSNIYWDCGNDGTGYDRINIPATVNQIKGKWNFWTFTKNATLGTMEIYLNGQLVGNGTGKTKLIDIKKMVAGMGMETGHPYLGSYDELSIWNKDLDQPGIQKIMFKDIDNTHPDYANLIAYYKLNEGVSDSAHDASPNNYSSALINPSWRTHRGHTLFRNFASTNYRPNVTFVKGVYTTSVLDIPVRDSVVTNPASVISYSVTNNNLNTIDTMFVWPAGYAYVFNTSGVKVDSIPVAAQDTLFVTQLNYYRKRPMRIELINFITPYGINLDLDGLNGKTWEFDVTDYTPVLKGPIYLAMEDGNHQEDNDIKFVFVEGTPPRTVKSVSQLWPSGTWVAPSYNEITSNKYFEPRSYILSPNASQFKIKSAISGHGQEGEFIARNHTIRLNNSINYSRSVWKACANNPIYPQGGTWVYDRAGWCPGAVVDTKEYEITSNVSSGDTILLDYSLPPNSNPGSSNYRVNNQLVSYDAPNFVLDAAVDYIKAPSKRTEFIRFNPLCNEPVVMIKNTGSHVLNSLDINYGRVNGVMSVYNWTGTLNFLDTVLITLPAPDWMTSNVDAFIAFVSNPNGGLDQYSNNDTLITLFDVPVMYPSTLVFDLRTNNAGSQTAYTLKDSQGNDVINHSGLLSNTFYKDTVNLNTECYTLKLTDAGKDGLSWWANPGQGTGYFRIIDPSNGVILKTFNPDFGDNIYQQFSVNFTLPVKDVVTKSIEGLLVYPNPTSDLFTAEFSLPLHAKAKLKLVNVLGEILLSETFLVTETVERVSMDISEIESGIYYVVLEAGDQRKMEKVVVVR